MGAKNDPVGSNGLIAWPGNRKQMFLLQTIVLNWCLKKTLGFICLDGNFLNHDYYLLWGHIELQNLDFILFLKYILFCPFQMNVLDICDLAIMNFAPTL